ncbi:MAG TPA: hypothetical protein VLZ74_13150 [Methylocella sp.]|nr:hypothetical protein [Methylocella sp.]
MADTTLPLRNVNIWVDAATPKTKKAFGIFVNVGELRKSAVTSAPFHEPSWPDDRSVDLLISLSSLHCDIEPGWTELKLPRYGNSETAEFRVVAAIGGNHQFTIRMYLAKQMIQLQFLTFDVFIGEAEAVLLGAN